MVQDGFYHFLVTRLSAPHPDALDARLADDLRALCQTPHLLIATDYDGTLSELVEDPSQSLPNAAALSALRLLAGIERTTVAIVSGRSLVDLDRFLGTGSPHIRIGSHGAEWAIPGVSLTAKQQQLLRELAARLSVIVGATPHVRCEIKPAGVALHYRGAARRDVERIVSIASGELGRAPGVFVRHGSEVVEFMVVRANKGEAVLRIKEATGASRAFFVGDDLTDEDVFRILAESDIGIRVGNGASHARHRVADVTSVAAVLTELGRQRRACVRDRGEVSG